MKIRNRRKGPFYRKFIILLEWTVFIGLILISGLYVEDVWRHYASNGTSIKVSRRKLEKLDHPNVTLCFKPFAKPSKMKGLNITIGDFAYGMDIDVKKAKSWLDFYHEASYNIGADFLITLDLEEYSLEINRSGTYNFGAFNLESEKVYFVHLMFQIEQHSECLLQQILHTNLLCKLAEYFY